MPSDNFDIKKFFSDSLISLSRPAEYYSKLEKDRGIGESIIISIIFGVAAGIFNFLSNIIGVSIFSGPMGKIFSGGLGILSFFGTVIGSLFTLFFAGILILTLSGICGGSTDFQRNLRVSASLMALFPVKALLGLITGMNYYSGMSISLATSLYGLWMLYHALRHALDCRANSAKTAASILVIIPVLILLSGLFCNKVADNISKEFRNFIPRDKDSSESIERLRKMMEEAQKNPKDK